MALIFEPQSIPDIILVKPVPHEDDRGYFARTFCQEAFAHEGLHDQFVQWSESFNHTKATLRGLHYQELPNEEVKLVRCTAGVVFDVAVDIRPRSATYGKYVAAELSAANGHALYIPKGFAHGFITLEEESVLLYGISPAYQQAAAAGIRWDDPTIAIDWPLAPEVISERDQQLPLLVT